MENQQNIIKNETINVAEIDVSVDKSPEFLMQNLHKIPILPVDKWKHYLQHWENKKFESRRVYEAAIHSILERAQETKKQMEKCNEINQNLHPFSTVCKVTPKNISVTSVSKPQVSQQLLNSIPGTSVTFVTSSSMNPPIKRERQSSDIEVPTQNDEVTTEECYYTKNSARKYKKKKEEPKPFTNLLLP